MTIWLIVLLITAVACGTLFYAAAGRTVNVAVPGDLTTEHFRAQLQSIENDSAVGRLQTAEATAAKAELAREVLRQKRDGAVVVPPATDKGRSTVTLAVFLSAALAVGIYAVLGHPELPAQPLAGRAAATATADPSVNLDQALKTIEDRLAKQPNDIRGWQVIGPAYMQLGRYADAVKAFRHVNELTTATAESQTDLGEALMMQNGGNASGEPLELFRKAVSMDATAVRARYYIAGEETRAGDYPAAARDWSALLALAKGDEPWVEPAKQGLAFAQSGGKSTGDAATASAPTQGAPGAPQIEAMVDGLEARLKSGGGSIAEWTQLVRSRLVQGRTADAQSAYDAAVKAYPDTTARAELDALATSSGLVVKSAP